MEKVDREPLADVDETAAYIRVTRKTLYNWRSQGIGPPAYKAGGTLRYRLSEVDAWLSARSGAPAA